MAETKRIGTKRTRGKAETLDSGEEMGVVAEVMGINPTSHTPKIELQKKHQLRQR